jgi:polyisoprenyl-teichoic acid--peptidoglycan teichoic acid transferase
VPDGGVEIETSPHAARGRRWWRHRSVKIVALAVVVLLVATTAGAGWLAWRYSQVARLDIDTLDEARSTGGGAVSENFLLVGSDSRAFVDGEADVAAYGTADEVGPPHADTILLVRTFPDLGRVAMVSFPRDLWLPIAGSGKEDRINAAVQGGADRLVATISENFGIPIHHYAQIDFRGFKGLVNAIDGVRIPFPAPVRDYDPSIGKTLTGLDIPEPGCITLDGDQALAYVRSRHYEQLVEGEWQPDPAGDLNRIQRQQDFVRRTFHQALSKGLLDPRRVDRLLTVAIENVSLDQALGLRDLVDLAGQFRSLTPDSLQTYALPTTPGTTPGGAQVLFLDVAAAAPVLDVFRGRSVEPEELSPSSVRVRVLNGSGRSGEVRVAAYRLAAAGFVVPGVGTLPVRLDQTRIRYGAGQEQAAALLAATLAPRPDVVADPTIQGVDVILDIGRDWERVLDPSEADAPVSIPTEPASGEPETPTELRPPAVEPAC